MKNPEVKRFDSPDDVTAFEKGKVHIVKLSAGGDGKIDLQPGWCWSEHVKPIVKTEWCEAEHVGYCLSGRMAVRMQDGSEFEMGAGDVGVLPPGQLTVEDIFGEGDRVFSRARLQGTNTGEWEILDQLELMRQLGLIEAPLPSARA